MSSLVGYPGHEILVEDIVRAENCTLHGAGGDRYVDLESGVWCATIGHGHPRVVDVIQRQAARIAHAGYCYTNEVVQSAAEEVLSVLGFEGGAASSCARGARRSSSACARSRGLARNPS
jgi:acetylornithine aminotransferase